MNPQFAPQITLRGMLSSIVTLRLAQFRWTLAYWSRALGLLPASGKWQERITFAYIYLLIVALMTPTAVSLLNGLYVLESKSSPALVAIALQNSLPALIAVLSIALIVIPWRAWMLRMTFGDITYLAAAPFDRRLLAVWRYLEVVLFISIIGLIPMTLLAPALAGGLLLAIDVLPAIGRGWLALLLWVMPMLALGWHISLQEYSKTPLPALTRWLGRFVILVAAGVVLYNNRDVLLWPGRLIVLLMRGDAPAILIGWPLLIAFAAVGVIVVALESRGLSMTRAAVGADVLARIQGLGYMVLVDRQLLLSILGEKRASESYAAGVLPKATGLLAIPARTALFYRRQYGQTIQLFAVGLAMGIGLLAWRPDNFIVVVVTAVLLVALLPSQLAAVFRSDMGVPFISQFIPQPLRSRLLASSLVPALIMLAGMIPPLVSLNALMPDWAWGVLPIVWVLSLIGHTDQVGKGTLRSDRNIFSVILGSAALFFVLWSAITSGVGGPLALVQSVAVAGSVSLILLMIADIRHGGTNPQALNTAKQPA